MMASTSNTFKNSFVENSQETSTPLQFFDTSGVYKQKVFSSRTQYCAVYANFGKNKDNELNVNRRIMKERPLQ